MAYKHTTWYKKHIICMVYQHTHDGFKYEIKDFVAFCFINKQCKYIAVTKYGAT